MLGIGFKINLKEDGDLDIEITDSPVGELSGSNKKDFYVYEWYIKETGEVFYVGKGRGDRYKKIHTNSPEAEKIRKTYETDIKFVKKDLTEIEAVELETEELKRILNNTNNILTNKFLPRVDEQRNGYEKSLSTTSLKFETAPTIYADEIGSHYFNKIEKHFDVVIEENLKNIYFDESYIRPDVLNIIYNSNLEKYLDESLQLLLENDCNIMSSKFSKSLTCWILCGDESLNRYEEFQEKYKSKWGKSIPVYHLIDVWKFLKKSNYETNSAIKKINANNNRIPLEQCKIIDDLSEEWQKLEKKLFKTDKLISEKKYKEALVLLDEIRASGYNYPQLYDSYVKAFIGLEDYDNVICILNEELEIYRKWNNPTPNYNDLDRWTPWIDSRILLNALIMKNKIIIKKQQVKNY